MSEIRKNLRNVVAGAACLAEREAIIAVESRDHAKNNGVSPSRGNNLTFHKMKKIFAILIVLVGFNFSSAFAQSTVYLIYLYPNNICPVPIKINNKDVFTMHFKTKKVCTLYSEGKVVISFNFPCVNNYVSPPITFQWSDEIQLTLSKNSVHYVKILHKGMNDLKFEELTEEKGKKELAKKKYNATADYVDKSSNTEDRKKEPSKGKVPTNSDIKIEE